MATVQFNANGTVTMRLEHSIGMTRFDATTANYQRQLRAHAQMPPALKDLLNSLFRQRAITKCTIIYGRQLLMTIAETNTDGKTLLPGKRLAQFQETFARIAGGKVAARWQAGNSGRDQGHRAPDYTGALQVLAALVEAAADGIMLAAAVDQLLDND